MGPMGFFRAASAGQQLLITAQEPRSFSSVREALLSEEPGRPWPLAFLLCTGQEELPWLESL